MKWYLMLDNVPCGFLTSFSGGELTADILNDASSSTFVHKRLGSVRYEPINISFSSMKSTLCEWINKAWNGSVVKKNGSILFVEMSGEIKEALDFRDATIIETKLPELDAAVKENTAISLTIYTTLTQRKIATGMVSTISNKEGNPLLTTNYKLEIDGIDCKKVIKIDPLNVQEKYPIDFPTLKVILDSEDSKSWYSWLEEFVGKGLNDASHEKNGSITYLSLDNKQKLLTIKLHNLGIFKLLPEIQTQLKESIPRNQETKQHIIAQFYCQRMEFVYP